MRSRVEGQRFTGLPRQLYIRLKKRFVFVTRDNGSELFSYTYVRRVMEISPIGEILLDFGSSGNFAYRGPRSYGARAYRAVELWGNRL